MRHERISEKHVLQNAVRLAKTIYPKHVWQYDLGVHVRRGFFEHVGVYMFIDGERWKTQMLKTLRSHTPLATVLIHLVCSYAEPEERTDFGKVILVQTAQKNAPNLDISNGHCLGTKIHNYLCGLPKLD